MSTSLCYLDLPVFLQEPVMAGHLPLDQAEALWNHLLQAPEGESPLPESLWPVAELLDLIRWEPDQTAH